MNILFFIILLAVIVGIILLQIYLSKRECRWPGLILPITSFVVSLIYPLNVMAGPVWQTIFLMVVVWVIANIPTMILLAIYFGCRGKQNRKKQMDKMKIQDL